MQENYWRIHLCLIFLLFVWQPVVAIDKLDFRKSQVNRLKELKQNIIRVSYQAKKLDARLEREAIAFFLRSLDIEQCLFLREDIAAIQQNNSKVFVRPTVKRLKQFMQLRSLLQARAAYIKQHLNEWLSEYLLLDTLTMMPTQDKSLAWPADKTAVKQCIQSKMLEYAAIYTAENFNKQQVQQLLKSQFQSFADYALNLSAEQYLQLMLASLVAVMSADAQYFAQDAPQNRHAGFTVVRDQPNKQWLIKRLKLQAPDSAQSIVATGDRLIAIKNTEGHLRSVFGMNKLQLMQQLQGAHAKALPLLVQNKQASFLFNWPQSSSVSVTKQDEISYEVKTFQGKRIAIIDYPAFYVDFKSYWSRDPQYKSSVRDLRRALEKLQGDIDAVVIDLRSNTGGSLQQVVDAVGLLAGPGAVMQLRNKRGAVELFKSDSKAVYRGPLLLWVSSATASAAEIFTDTLQSRQRAIVLGQATIGYGAVYSAANLARGHLRFIQAEIFKLNGQSLNAHGITPDIALPAQQVSADAVRALRLSLSALPSAQLASIAIQSSAADPNIAGLRQASLLRQMDKPVMSEVEAEAELLQITYDSLKAAIAELP